MVCRAAIGPEHHHIRQCGHCRRPAPRQRAQARRALPPTVLGCVGMAGRRRSPSPGAHVCVGAARLSAVNPGRHSPHGRLHPHAAPRSRGMTRAVGVTVRAAELHRTPRRVGRAHPTTHASYLARAVPPCTLTLYHTDRWRRACGPRPPGPGTRSVAARAHDLFPCFGCAGGRRPAHHPTTQTMLDCGPPPPTRSTLLRCSAARCWEHRGCWLCGVRALAPP